MTRHHHRNSPLPLVRGTTKGSHRYSKEKKQKILSHCKKNRPSSLVKKKYFQSPCFSTLENYPLLGYGMRPIRSRCYPSLSGFDITRLARLQVYKNGSCYTVQGSHLWCSYPVECRVCNSITDVPKTSMDS